MNKLIKIKHTHYFNLLDTDSNGLLDEKDFLQISLKYCSAFGLQTSSRWYASIQKTFMDNWLLLSDTMNIQHSITLEHWLYFSSNHLLTNQDTYQQFIVNQTKLIIDLFDTNRDGYLQFNEYIDMLKCYNIPTQSALDAFKVLDQNHDKKISKIEIIVLLKSFFTSQNIESPGNSFFGIIPSLQALSQTSYNSAPPAGNLVFKA